jgi:hypothetical protein
MQPLADAQLLDLWERGRPRHPVDRGVLALGAALPAEAREGLADVPVSRRDALLLQLRCATFGARLSACVACPACREGLEFELDAQTVRDWQRAGARNEVVECAGLRFRLPTSRDLREIAGLRDARQAARRLAELCLLDRAPESLEWSAELLSQLDDAFDRADPGGNIELALVCVACGQSWSEAFDVVGFFWEEIDARARSIMQEIHRLATAYGWTEGEILSLGPSRRAGYLEMVDE